MVVEDDDSVYVDAAVCLALVRFAAWMTIAHRSLDFLKCEAMFG